MNNAFFECGGKRCDAYDHQERRAAEGKCNRSGENQQAGEFIGPGMQHGQTAELNAGNQHIYAPDYENSQYQEQEKTVLIAGPHNE